jgi:glycosyltransferase involved in cell wall biosynthesis
MVESLACGTPVVATNTIGGVEVRTTFPEDVTVVPSGHPDTLAEAICRLLPLRRRTAPETLDRLRRDFAVSACADRYLGIYRQAFAGAPAT